MIGPNGEKRPGDVLANALRVAKIATGNAEEIYLDEGKRPSGQNGGRARAEALTADHRKQIAKSGAGARWGKQPHERAGDDGRGLRHPK